MRDFGQDVRDAVRQLGRSWGFTATAVIALADAGYRCDGGGLQRDLGSADESFSLSNSESD